MSGETLPLDLKKVLRERMLSLLQGKSQSGTGEASTSSHDAAAANNTGNNDEKRKQIAIENVVANSAPTASPLTSVSCEGFSAEPQKTNSRPVAVALPQPRPEPKVREEEVAPIPPFSDQPRTLPQPQRQPSVAEETLTATLTPSDKLPALQEKSNKTKFVADTKSSHKDKDRKKSIKEKAEKTTRHSHKEAHSSSRKRAKTASSSLSCKHRSKLDKSRRWSHSRESHRNSNDKSHESKHKESRKHAKKRSRSRSISKDRHRSLEKGSSRKKKVSYESGTIFDEMNVDPNELEKFVKDLVVQHKTGPPPNGSSGSGSYMCTFKRHPSPTPRRSFSSSRRHHFDIATHYSTTDDVPAKKSSHDVPTTTTISTSQDQTSGTAHNNGKKTLKELTDFCRKIAEQNKTEKKRHRSADDDSDHDSSEPGADSLLNMKTSAHNAIKMKIKDAKELKAKSAIEQLEAMYPVSTGMDHMCRERDSGSKWTPEQVNPAFHRLIQRRLEAVRVLTQNPNDYAALLTIEECDAKISSWATSPTSVLDAQLSTPAISQPSTSIVPSQPLPIQGPQPPPPYANVPPEAIPTSHLSWAHPEYLHMIARAKLDIGKKLLERLGWREGFGLGKDLGGNKDPILPDVKLDRKGLHAETEVQQPRPLIAKVVAANNGKHPVSMLQEISAHHRWGAPNFEVTEILGPPHRQSFIMRVTVNGVVYQPTSACPTKKEAKALAATLCLQSLGLWRGQPSEGQKQQ